jgi:hypothetical protein
MSKPDPKIVRAWASVNGIPVAQRGRMKPEVFAAYAAAHPVDGQPHPAETPASGVVDTPTPAMSVARTVAQSPGWADLRTLAEMFHDAQKARIAAGQRIDRNDTVDPRVLAAFKVHLDNLNATEEGLRKALRTQYRATAPIGVQQWAASCAGIGEKLLARLLGHLGDPLVATPHAYLDEAPDGHECDPLRCKSEGGRHLVALEPFERSISQLWSYCGHGDAKRKRVKGMTADDATGLGSPTCKSLVHLMAQGCVKANGIDTLLDKRYGKLYYVGKERYADRVDDAGKPWTDMHKHNAALRLVGKEILKDLYLARRDGWA